MTRPYDLTAFHRTGIKRLLWFLGAALGLIAFVSLLALTITATAHHRNAQAFWGDRYAPTAPTALLAPPQSWVVPLNGPLADRAALDLCYDTPVPVVPIRLAADRFEALCGLGTSTYVTPFDIEDAVLKRKVRSDLEHRRQNREQPAGVIGSRRPE